MLYPAHARSAQAHRTYALRALGLLLADGAFTVGWGKTFWCISQFLDVLASLDFKLSVRQSVIHLFQIFR